MVFIEGNAWCRQCGYKTWWTEDRLDVAAVRKIEEQKRQRTSALYQTMHQCTLWQDYYRHDQTYESWYREGRMDPQDVDKWGLGFCSSCPTVPDHASLTIPVWYKGKLWDIRHRVLGAEDREKYRSHMPGLSPMFFNLDCVGTAKRLYVVEGEKKTIRAVGIGMDCTIGYPGMQHIGKLVPILEKIGQSVQELIFVPDPGSESKILELRKKLSMPCYMVELWEKFDDFVDLYGKESFYAAARIPTPI